MNITSWNVNSIRARMDRVLGWIDDHRPDVLCLQELKCLDSELALEPFRERGYDVATHGQRTYNGVAILSRIGMADVVRGIPDPDDPQARGIAATVGGVRIVDLYVPNGGDLASEKYPYKLAWLDKLLAFLQPPASGLQPLLVCGDFNIAPADDDVYDPEAMKGQVLCTDAERSRFRALLGKGLTDSFRRFEPRSGRYTWWDYRGNGWGLDHGLRIDHHLVSAALLPRVVDVSIDREERDRERASDHAPVTLHLADA